MKRNIGRISIGLCGLLLVALLVAAGCQQAPAAAPAGTPSSGAQSAAPSSTSPAQAPKPTVYKFGSIQFLTGYLAENGKRMKDAIDMAVDEFNGAGGIGGVKVQVIHEDGQALPKESVTAFNKLVSMDQVPAVLASGSAVNVALAPIAESSKVVVINSAGISPDLAGVGKFTFNNVPLVTLEIKVLSEYATKNLGLKRLAILHTSDALGLGIKKALEKDFVAAGGTIVGAEGFEATAKDHTAQLAKLKDANPDAIYLASGSHGLIMKEIGQLGMKVQILSYFAGGSLMPGDLELAGQMAEGRIFTQPASGIDNAFQERYKARFGNPVDFSSASSYDAAQILAKAIDYAAQKGWGYNGAALQKAIHEIREFSGVTGKAVFDESGGVTKDVSVMIHKGGKEILLQTFTASK